VNRNGIGRVIILAVALHSFVLGMLMLLAPRWTLRLAGWPYDGPLFFPAQSGIFLLILGSAYFAAAWFRPFAWLLVGSKAAAVVFLVTCSFLDAAPPQILACAAADGLMGAAVAWALLDLRVRPRQSTSANATSMAATAEA
jgi:hypothetical protein